MNKNVVALFTFMLIGFLGIAQRGYQVELKKFVSPDGWVNYEEWKNEQQGLNKYLEEAKSINPKELPDLERKAFYINLYNAATIKLILDNYPLASITDLEKPWDKAFINVSGRGTLSLNDIENNILRKDWKDPRIHFAINCASYSCPKLYNTLFEASTLNSQLEEATANFFQDSLRNTFNDGAWKVSKIFDWFAQDFEAAGGSMAYIKKYVDKKAPKELSFLEYNWALNKR